ncbi:hypothetical protein Tco_1087145 [Tanacetum coccineum]
MSFIDNPEFIAFYGVRYSQPYRLLLRYKEIIDPLEFKHISFVDDVTFPQQQQDFSPNVSDLVKQLRCSIVIGTSCGLWCFHDYSSRPYMLVIWNPSIGKSVGIVVPRLLVECTVSPGYMQITTPAFGVCPSTYDPTIVIMSYLETKDTDLPISLANQVALDISISELNESLVVSAYINELFTINIPGLSTMTLLGFRKSGQPLLETVKKDEEFAVLEVYKPCSKHINNLGIYEEHGDFRLSHPYYDQLILVPIDSNTV